MLLKKLLIKRPDLKVILMSATMNTEKFSSYFQRPLLTVPVINIPGKIFSVKQLFLEDIFETLSYNIQSDPEFEKYERKKKVNCDFDLVLSNFKVKSAPIPDEKKADKDLSLLEILTRYNKYSPQTCKNLHLMGHNNIYYDLTEKLIEFIIDGEHNYPKTGSILVSKFLYYINIIKDNFYLIEIYRYFYLVSKKYVI